MALSDYPAVVWPIEDSQHGDTKKGSEKQVGI